eukprot:2194208-Alexandrium_andersonii.AAC.1
MVWLEAEKGSLKKGIHDVGGSAKCFKMMWCIGEAIKIEDQSFMRSAVTCSLARDATCLLYTSDAADDM